MVYSSSSIQYTHLSTHYETLFLTSFPHFFLRLSSPSYINHFTWNFQRGIVVVAVGVCFFLFLSRDFLFNFTLHSSNTVYSMDHHMMVYLAAVGIIYLLLVHGIWIVVHVEIDVRTTYTLCSYHSLGGGDKPCTRKSFQFRALIQLGEHSAHVRRSRIHMHI